LFIFSTSKVTPVRLLPIVCSPSSAVDPQIVVQIICEHFNYQWETRLSQLDQTNQSWHIKPTNPCGLDPFQLQIIITINGERKILLDRYANIVCKASEFPKGLAHLLIQERNGKQVTPEVFNKLKKKKSVQGIRLDLPNFWEPIEQWRVIDNIWHALDPKNNDRPLCKSNGPFPVLQPSQQFIDSIPSNPLGQYRTVWIWMYGVLRFYTMFYSSMKNHIGRIPECIDRQIAEKRLYNSPHPSLLIRFGSEGETIVCSTWDNGNMDHLHFSWKSKPTGKTFPFTQLPKHLIQLSEKQFQYLSPPNQQITLDEVLSVFSVCLNQPLQSQAPQVDTRVITHHCQILTQYIQELRYQGSSSISIEQLNESLQEVMISSKVLINGGSPVVHHQPTSNVQSPNVFQSSQPIMSGPGYPSAGYSPQPPMGGGYNIHGAQMRASAPSRQIFPPQQNLYSPGDVTGYNTSNNSANTFNTQHQHQHQHQHPHQVQQHQHMRSTRNPFATPSPDAGQFPAVNHSPGNQQGGDEDMFGEFSGDHFLELINNSGPDDILFSSLYPQGNKKRKLTQAFEPIFS